MTQPLIVDLPHRLGAAEAKRRIAGGIGKLKDQVPGGAEVESSWEGNRLNLEVTAMNQTVSAHIDVRDATLRVEILLPAALSFFSKPIEAMLRRKGTEMLEDKGGGARP